MIKQEATLSSWVLHVLEQSSRFFDEQGQSAYLVGGSIRNLLLRQPCVDWDIATTGDIRQLARLLADRLGGFYAPMHERASRVIVKQELQELVLDLSPLQGSSIEEDLCTRDFTINAIAAPFGAAMTALTIESSLDAFSALTIDPLHGREDLAQRTLRVTTDATFQKDPLRLLRAVRFALHYQLKIEPETTRLIKRDAYLLPRVASERLHEELYSLLRSDGASARLRFLDSYGLLTILIPELEPGRGMQQPSLHHWDVFEHSLEAVATLERLARTLQQRPEEIAQSDLEAGGQGDMLAIQQLLREAEQQKIFSFARLTSPEMKLAALLHDIGKTTTHAVDEEGNITFYHHPQAGIPLAKEITRRLSVSTHDSRAIQQVVAHHMRPGQLSHDSVTPRAIRRFFVDLGPNGIYVALVSLADHLSMRGPEPLTIHWQRHRGTVRTLLTRYIRERQQILPPRLIQSEELIRRFKLSPGPLIGQILEAIAEAQAEGVLHSKEEVLWFVEEKLQQIQPDREK
ncbi:polynucleotide adenylyltransferase [Dictyobacter vulcani]|uniref:Polynucleotide adenylyltransferase n=1 Tax=Dictyobacter vulcani TaxID=2607529 RepID=A0A5J4KS47_9CHLR|nr:HD domain-containing protein [Dictyobacter vulcani]GER89250.1 polynucleotide adenylyltransferase [Dictyobacter vulcani]